MLVHVTNRQSALAITKRAVRVLAEQVITAEGYACDEVGIHFVTVKEISKLHGEYFNDPSSTDCISFPIDSEFLGDVFVCPEVAIDYAKKHGIDPYQELARYVIHGLLHLMDYDDLEPSKKRQMRRAETKHLANCSPLC